MTAEQIESLAASHPGDVLAPSFQQSSVVSYCKVPMGSQYRVTLETFVRFDDDGVELDRPQFSFQTLTMSGSKLRELLNEDLVEDALA